MVFHEAAASSSARKSLSVGWKVGASCLLLSRPFCGIGVLRACLAATGSAPFEVQ